MNRATLMSFLLTTPNRGRCQAPAAASASAKPTRDVSHAVQWQVALLPAKSRSVHVDDSDASPTAVDTEEATPCIDLLSRSGFLTPHGMSPGAPCTDITRIITNKPEDLVWLTCIHHRSLRHRGDWLTLKAAKRSWA